MNSEREDRGVTFAQNSITITQKQIEQNSTLIHFNESSLSH